METLSILIPVFNWDCSALLRDLHSQGCGLNIPFEIIVVDDCSTDFDKLQPVRDTANELQYCSITILENNIGRSAIRNMLADMARYDKLLFMDCDAAVCSPSYLNDYMLASKQADVVCGGVVHPERLPMPGVELRWKYERNADRHRSAKYRSKTPYDHFTPFNFLISRDTFQEIRFDTTFCGYGYEDVLFGMKMQRLRTSVLHIDNPLVHLGLESNERYLLKTKEAVSNLLVHRDQIGQGSTLLQHYDRICRWHLEPLLAIADRLLFEPVLRNLHGNRPGLKRFALYKLLTIYRLQHKNSYANNSGGN